MQKCWKETPDKRPTFSSLKTMFAEMLQESNPYIQLDNINTHKAYYANPNTLDNGNVVPVNQSDDRSSIADNTQYLSSASATSSSSSSSASTPMESSSYELLKGNAGSYVVTYNNNTRGIVTIICDWGHYVVTAFQRRRIILVRPLNLHLHNYYCMAFEFAL